MQTENIAPQNTNDIGALVLRARAGEAAAFTELCARLAPAIRAYARRRLGQPAAVEDFAQDALLVFVEAVKAGRLEDPSRAAGFALGICHNLARERAKIRDRRRDAVERFADFPEATLPTEPLLNRARLEDCLSQLTGKARQVISGSYYAGSTDAELAEELALTPANVRVIRHRSIAALRSCVETNVVSWRGVEGGAA